MTDAERNGEAGWTNYGGGARKWHYTDTAKADGRSLCGKWARNPFAGGRPLNLEPDSGKSPDDCAVCRRKVDARVPAQDDTQEGGGDA